MHILCCRSMDKFLRFISFFCAVLLGLMDVACLSQIPCEDGFAGIYECENVNLLAHIPPSEIDGALTNEVWGWTDPLDGKEYVLLGASTGMYFFDISNPLAPIEIGHLPKHTFNSLWRTFRTYNNFLFVCSEANDHGMQVFDLTRLRNVENPPVIFTEDAHYDGFGDCHTLAIHEETGFAYACGTATYAGGLHIVNIQNPLEPAIAGGYDLNGYTHEAGVWIYDGPDEDYTGRTIAVCFNGSASLPLTIVDVTDPSDASTISLTSYPQQNYCHQGWFTEDKAYMLVNDELDEYYNFADSMHTHIFDMHDLDNPVYMGYHVGGTTIDHNLYIVGNLAYQSNYTDGLTILNVCDIADTTLTRVAYFDHFPGDPEIFQGEWMNYPYFESGVVPVTDIYNGLFLLQPDFLRLDGPSQACSVDGFSLGVEMMPGFEGPFTLTWQNLPEGFLPLITQPDADHFIISFDLSGALAGDYNVALHVEGAYHGYTESFAISVLQPSTWYQDTDQDGFGLEEMSVSDCEQPSGYAGMAGDCEDNNMYVYPGGEETQDGTDSNCNGLLDAGEQQICADLDNDGLVELDDLHLFNANFLCTGEECIADYNQDGVTDITDLFIFLSDFGELCAD
jgi:choice-of-anchor B domain-containing protein